MLVRAPSFGLLAAGPAGAGALCSSSDRTHDDLMEVHLHRFSVQIETAGTEEVLAAWGCD